MNIYLYSDFCIKNIEIDYINNFLNKFYLNTKIMVLS